jgi:hypothetical protein
MSFDTVDMGQLGVGIPATFKRMAELQSILRDATSGRLDILKRLLSWRSAGRVIVLGIIAIIIK